MDNFEEKRGSKYERMTYNLVGVTWFNCNNHSFRDRPTPGIVLCFCLGILSNQISWFHDVP